MINSKLEKKYCKVTSEVEGRSGLGLPLNLAYLS